MTSPFFICLLFFVLTGRCFSRNDECLKKYVPLIYDVHEYYRTSSVFFLFSSNDHRLQDYTFVHFLSRDFSQKGVISLVINYEELDERMKFYRRHIVRPLFVVFLKTMRNIVELHKNIREINTSYPIWLIIFANEVGKSVCEYCAHPMGNILQVRFDTEMVVKCCDDPIMTEWWSTYENRTEISNFATWTENEGLKLLVSGVVYARRREVNGAGFRIAYVTDSVISQSVNKIAHTYWMDVMMELKRAMNFTIITELSVGSFGSFNSITKNWTGVVGQLARRQVDLGVAEFTITNSRLDVIDFTLPLLLTPTRLYIKQPDGSAVQWSAYFQAFTIEIWMTIILLLITSSVLLTIMKIKKNNVSRTSLVVENYLCVWGLFCQQGLCMFPAETSLRIAFFSILVSAVIVFAAYSASLTSFLTVSTATLAFNSLPGFVNDGSYKLIVIQNSSNYDLFNRTSNRVLQEMMKMMKPWRDLPKSFKEGFQQVCEERVAFYTNSVVKKMLNKYITCEIVSIETERVDSLAMAMAPDSQYNGVVDYHLQRFQDDGTLNRLKQKYLSTEQPAETTFDVVSLWGVAPILSVLAGGIILAVVILFFERMYFFLNKYAQRWELTTHSQNSKMDERFNVSGKKTAITLESTASHRGGRTLVGRDNPRGKEMYPKIYPTYRDFRLFYIENIS